MTWILEKLTAKLSLSIIGALLLALAGLSAYVWGLPIIGGGLLAELAEAIEDRDEALRDVKRLIDESNRRKEAGKQAIEADKPKAEARAKARTIIQYRESVCETPADIQDALDAGWQR